MEIPAPTGKTATGTVVTSLPVASSHFPDPFPIQAKES